jgi:hypothetical protein
MQVTAAAPAGDHKATIIAAAAAAAAGKVANCLKKPAPSPRRLYKRLYSAAYHPTKNVLRAGGMPLADACKRAQQAGLAAQQSLPKGGKQSRFMEAHMQTFKTHYVLE